MASILSIPAVPAYRLVAASLALALAASHAGAEPADAEKTIVDAAWTTADFSRPITQAPHCRDIGLLITTQGYAPGDVVQVTVGVKNLAEYEVSFSGTVEADGKVRVPVPASACEDARAAQTSVKASPPPDSPNTDALTDPAKKQLPVVRAFKK